MLISIDGIDGCGKSTQIRHISGMTGAKAIQEISDSHWGRIFRSLESPTLAEQIAYFLADRAGLSPMLTEAAGSEAHHIVSDRSYLSGVAYQSFNSGLAPEMIEQMNRALVPEYDAMLVLDLPVEVSLERVKKRGEKLTWCENDALLTWARRVFQTWSVYRDNIYLINADQPPEQVSAEITKVLTQISNEKFGRVLWESEAG